MGEVGLESYQKQLDDCEISEHDGSLDDEFDLLRLNVVPAVGHAHDDLHHEDGAEDQFGGEVEDDDDVVLAIVHLHESPCPAHHH